jgi:hypothetical protein
MPNASSKPELFNPGALPPILSPGSLRHCGLAPITVTSGTLPHGSPLPALDTKPGHPCASTILAATLVQE